MTKKELIEKLKDYPDDYEIRIRDYFACIKSSHILTIGIESNKKTIFIEHE